MKRYQIQGTYRIYFNAENDEQARKFGDAFKQRAKGAINDGVLKTEAQFDGSVEAIGLDPRQLGLFDATTD